MKRTIITLSAILCVGVAQVGITHTSKAQTTPLGFDQVLALGRQGLGSKNFEAAERDARDSLVLARSPQEKGQSLSLLAEALYHREAYAQAREQWNAVLDLRGTNDDENTHAFAHLGLARTYSAQGSYNQAIPHYKAAIDYFEQKNVKQLTALFSLSLADAYYHTHKNDLAREQLNRVVAYSQNIPILLVVAHTRFGQINFEQQQFDQARANYEQVLRQVDAVNFGNSKPKVFAERQIAVLNVIKKMIGDGAFPKGTTSTVNRPDEFDDDVSQFIIELVDGSLLNETIVDMLRE